MRALPVFIVLMTAIPSICLAQGRAWDRLEPSGRPYDPYDPGPRPAPLPGAGSGYWTQPLPPSQWRQEQQDRLYDRLPPSNHPRWIPGRQGEPGRWSR